MKIIWVISTFICARAMTFPSEDVFQWCHGNLPIFKGFEQCNSLEGAEQLLVYQ